MKQFYLLLLLFTTSTYSQKQSNNLIKEKLESTLQQCKALYDADDYKKLLVLADEGLKLSVENKLYLSKFYFYKGYAFEFGNNQYKQATECFEKSLKLAQISKNLKQETLALMR